MVKTLKSVSISIFKAIRSLFLMTIMALKSLLFLPILIFMVWVSYYVDPSSFFHGDKFELEAALALIEGNSLSSYEQLDERQINMLHIDNSQQAYEVAILGSSRGLQIGEEFFPNRTFYNYGMVAASYTDIANTFYTMVKEDRVPVNTIIVVDPWIFYHDEYYQDHRSDTELYQEFLSLALGKESDYVPPDTTAAYEALLSPSFFQSSFEYYLRGGDLEVYPEILESNIYTQDTEVKRYDGTIIYTEEYRNRTQDLRDLDALTLAGIEFTTVHGFNELEQYGKDLFVELIEYIKTSDTNLILMMTPYHPIVYDSAVKLYEEQPGMLQVEEFVLSIAKQYDIPVYGSYDPSQVNCLNTDFYDHIHVTAEGISKFIDPLMDELV